MKRNKCIIRSGFVCVVILLFVSGSFALTPIKQNKDVLPNQVRGVHPLDKSEISNPVIKSGTYKIQNYGPGKNDIPSNLIDLNDHSQVLSSSCDGNGECTYTVSRLASHKDSSQVLPLLASEDQYIEQAYWFLPGGYNVPQWLTTNWYVPSSPTYYVNGQLDAYFPSLDGATSILQPVLEYGQQGRQYWDMSAWYVHGNDYAWSNPVRVNVGDRLTGSVYRDSPGSNWWNIQVFDQTTRASTSLRVNDPEPIGLTSMSLETYNVQWCEQLPGPATFTDIVLNGLTPNWQINQFYTGCNLGVTIKSPKSVALNTI